MPAFAGVNRRASSPRLGGVLFDGGKIFLGNVESRYCWISEPEGKNWWCFINMVSSKMFVDESIGGVSYMVSKMFVDVVCCCFYGFL